MAVIKLTIQPDKASLEKTVKEINESLKGIQGLKIKVDSSAEKAVHNVAAGLKEASQAAGQAAQNIAAGFHKATSATMEYDKRLDDMRNAAKALEGEFGKLQRIVGSSLDGSTGKFTKAVAEFGKAGEEIRKVNIELDKEGNLTHTLVSGMEDVAAAAKRTAKEKEKYARQVAEVERQIAREREEVSKEQRAKVQEFERQQREYEREQHRKRVEEIQFEAQVQRELREDQERAEASRQKAAKTSVTLERQYSNLIRQIQNLKAQYPEGTFDAIEQQAREAREELRRLDKTTENYADRVKASSGVYSGLQRDLSNARQETAKLDKVTESFFMNIQKFARWYIGGNLVVNAINSLREALSTMKEVDKELANIQKVTDRTDAEMQKLADSAYEAASAYGVTAQAYLESAAEFAKAGFGDQAESLAETAIKTQLVGDVTSDIADKFLISSNAAWKMNGSITELNKALDAANTIENNYATTIEKLAAGMPIAANVAAQAGMTFEETIAALGTITSVTQETGTKAATALRALILNIIGAVGEYEDGIEVTEESVKSLDGILQVYAKDALAAAKAAGTVINPMEAIAALAKASEEGLVNQAELFEVLSSLGGKLRTNQLTALVENYGTYLEMLDKTADSAGSADKEIGILLDTWDAKVNILKNTWTEFVTNFVNTEAIKLGLDGVIGLVELLNTGVGKAVIISAGLPAVVLGIAGAVTKLKTEVAKLNLTMLKNPVYLAIAGGTAALYGIVKLFDALTTSTQEYADAAKKAQETYFKTQDEVEALKTKTSELTDIERQKLVILQEQEKIQKEQLRRAKEDEYNSLYGDINAYEKAKNLVEQYLAYKNRLENTTDPEVFEKTAQGLNNVYTNILDTLSGLLEFREIIGQLPPSGNEAVRVLNELVNSLQGVEEATGEAGGSANRLGSETKTLAQILKEVGEAAGKMDTAIEAVTSALDDYGEGSIEVYNAMKALEVAIPGSTEKLYDFETATWLVDTASVSAKDSLLDFIDTNKQLEFSDAINELEALTEAYWDLSASIVASMANQQAADQMAGVLSNASAVDLANVSGKLGELRAQKAQWDAQMATLRQRKDYRGTATADTGGSTSYSTTRETETADLELERLRSIVEMRKQELAFLEASGGESKDIVDKNREIQSSLHAQAEYMRTVLAGMNDENSTAAERLDYEREILALSTEWWSVRENILSQEKTEVELAQERVALLKSELALLEASNATLSEINAKRKEIQAALHDEAEAMRAVEEDQADINALSTEWWNIQKEIADETERELEARRELFDTLKATIDEYYDKALSDKEQELTAEEKILAVQKAQVALANAMNERTVRYYNAASGQWEWTANKKTVEQAEEELKSAEKEFLDYQKELAWSEFKAAWEEVAAGVRSGDITFRAAYGYMYQALGRIQDNYTANVDALYKNSFAGIEGALTAVMRDSLGRMQTEGDGYSSALAIVMQDSIDRMRTAESEYSNVLLEVLEDSIGGWSNYNVTIHEFTEQMAQELSSMVGVIREGTNRLGEVISSKGTSDTGTTTTTVGGGGSSGGGGGSSGSSGRVVGSGYSGTISNNMSVADSSQAGILRQAEEAKARGDSSTYWNLMNSLRTNGEFASVQNANGTVTGYMVAISGAPNGEYTEVMGGKSYAELGAGTKLMDAWGRYWHVADNGVDIVPDDGNYSGNWYLSRGGAVADASTAAAASTANGSRTGSKNTLGSKTLDSKTALSKNKNLINQAASLRGTDGTVTSSKGVLGSAVTSASTTMTNTSIGTQNNGDVYTFNGISLTPAQAEMMNVKQLANIARTIGSFNNY